MKKLISKKKRPNKVKVPDVYDKIQAMLDEANETATPAEPTLKEKRIGWLAKARAVKDARKAGVLEADKEVPGNGHKETALNIVNSKVVESVVVPFKYEAWRPAVIPTKFAYMTPNWLFACIHMEEQAKVARVKSSAIGEKLKVGAAIVVLVLFVIVIFLFGVIMMDQGGA